MGLGAHLIAAILRHRDGRQNADDGDHDQKLDQGKAAAAATTAAMVQATACCLSAKRHAGYPCSPVVKHQCNPRGAHLETYCYSHVTLGRPSSPGLEC